MDIEEPVMRVGIGYDIHKLEAEHKLVLGGVQIPFEEGLVGWSDGDALIHAVIDALLGAAALGDIGTNFPSGDSKYKGISSLVLLRETGKLLSEKVWQIGNIDVTVMAQAPKLAPFIDQMRSRIAEALSIGKEQVSIKAKSSNGLGDIGRGEAIAAHAIVLIF
jgi:2-C-methyl-D-erythritol 2,4-cyclodiphosphate synthase